MEPPEIPNLLQETARTLFKGDWAQTFQRDKERRSVANSEAYSENSKAVCEETGSKYHHQQGNTNRFLGHGNATGG